MRYSCHIAALVAEQRNGASCHAEVQTGGPTWCRAASLCTAPCGTQSVVGETSGVRAKVGAFHAAVSVRRSVLTTER